MTFLFRELMLLFDAKVCDVFVDIRQVRRIKTSVVFKSLWKIVEKVRACATAKTKLQIFLVSSFSFCKFFSYFSWLYVKHDISPGLFDCLKRNQGSQEVKNLYMDIYNIIIY